MHKDERVTDAMVEAGLAEYSEGGCMGLDDRERREVVTAIIEAAVTAVPCAHSDDEAVDRFSAAMKNKLAQKREEGRGGWDNDNKAIGVVLSNMLRDHVEKGDPIDVANLAMMLHQRGERIRSTSLSSSPEEQKAVKVKPLEWRQLYPEHTMWPKDWHGTGVQRARYVVTQSYASGDFYVCGRGFSSLEEAKQYADTDYATSIRSALVDVPAVEQEQEPVGWDLVKGIENGSVTLDADMKPRCSPARSAIAPATAGEDVKPVAVKACPGADDPEERCPRHPRDCSCWQVDFDHPMCRSALPRTSTEETVGSATITKGNDHG